MKDEEREHGPFAPTGRHKRLLTKVAPVHLAQKGAFSHLDSRINVSWPAMEQELLNVFRDLKFNVNVLLALTAVLVIIGAIRVFLVCRWHAMELRGKSFRLIAEDLFETGNFESLEAVCNDKLKKRPAHADAHWYLGKSLFAQKRYQDAKAHLERLIELEPGWDASHVRPYLDRIEAVRVDRQTPTSFS